MMTPRLAASMALCLAIPSLGQSPSGDAGADTHSNGQPRLYVEERVVELGRMLQGEKKKASFVIENRGSAPLNIESVRAACGCTIPRDLSKDERRVEPGASITLEAVFDSRGRRGKQRKAVTVATNDPIEPNLRLFIATEIVTPMEVLVDGRPLRVVPLGRISPGERVAKTIEILPSEPGKELEVVSLDVKSEALTHEIEPLAKDDRKGSLLELAVAPDAIPGPLSAQIEITGRIGDDRTHMDLRAYGEIVGELTYTPLQIRQTSPLIHGGWMTPVRIRSDVGRPFEILSAEAGPDLEVIVTPEKDGMEHLVKLKIKEAAPPGPFGTYLDIRTTSVVQPLIRIPVFGYVRSYVDAYPPAVFLSESGGEERSARTVKLETATRAPFEVTGVSVESPYVTAAVTEIPGRQARGIRFVRVEATDDAPPGIHETVVRIQTDVAGGHEVTIPVTLQAT